MQDKGFEDTKRVQKISIDFDREGIARSEILHNNIVKDKIILFGGGNPKEKWVDFGE